MTPFWILIQEHRMTPFWLPRPYESAKWLHCDSQGLNRTAGVAEYCLCQLLWIGIEPYDQLCFSQWIPSDDCAVLFFLRYSECSQPISATKEWQTEDEQWSKSPEETNISVLLLCSNRARRGGKAGWKNHARKPIRMFLLLELTSLYLYHWWC